MPNNNLILRTVNSPWTTPTADFTKNSVLSHANVDNNFIYLRGELIYTAVTVGSLVTLKKINGNDLSFNVGSGGGSTYWTSGSTGFYSIKTVNDSGLDATGNYSVAQGFNTLASGNASHAEGTDTIASGNTSHAEGINTIAGGDYSHAEGQNTTASGINSHAEGFDTTASDESAHAEGGSTVASGPVSHAEGDGTTASAIASHAEGGNTTASANFSHAEGRGTTASGTASHSEGVDTIASGDYSHAGGSSSTASGNESFIHSTNSLVSGVRSAVIGGQNITGTTDDTVYVPYLNIGLLGAGASVNNLGIDSNGNVVSATSASVYWVSQTGALVDTNTTIAHTTLNTNTDSIIGGGRNNKLDSSDNASIIGGLNNNILTGDTSLIIGGQNNDIQARSGSNLSEAGILGGVNNNIVDTTSDSDRSFIIGSVNSNINDSTNSTIIGSSLSNISNASQNGFVLGSIGDVVSSTYSGIIGGTFNVMNNADRSVIIGGQNITGTTDDTVYVPYLNIGLANSGTPIAALSLDANNNVITGATGLSSGSCISDLYVTNIHGCSPVTIKDDLIVEGDLTILGSATTVDIKSEEVHIADNFVLLNSNVSGGTPTENSGIDVRRGDQPNGRILWNETDDRWEVGTSGTTYEVITTNNIGSFTGNTLQNVLDNGSSATLTSGFAYIKLEDTATRYHDLRILDSEARLYGQFDATNFSQIKTAYGTAQMFGVNGTNSSQINVSSQISLEMSTTGGSNYFDITPSSTFFRDDINSQGIVYYADYSSNFTNRSLVDKEYVDNTVSGATIWSQSGSSIYYNDGNVGVGVINTSAKLHINNTGSSASFLVEDSVNPDSTPFVISSGGSVSIGTTEAFSAGGTKSKLQTSSGSSGVSFTGLPVSSVAVFESNTTNAVGLLSPDASVSQVYFGTPSDVFGAFLRWDYTNKDLTLSTASADGEIVFQTDTGVEAARIDANGRLGIGTATPTNKLDVRGNAVIANPTSAAVLTISGATTQDAIINFDNTGVSTPFARIMGNTFGGGISGNLEFYTYPTGGPLTKRMTLTPDGEVGIGSMANNDIQSTLHVEGETLLSGSGQNILTVIGNGSTDPLFKVEGSAGELFTITDSLTGTLFAVNDISGLPILEVNSDDEILMGNYQAPSLNTTFKTTITSGSTELYSIPVSAYTGGFFEYTLTGAGARAGSIMSIFSGSSVNFTETTTTDIGDTSSVTFDMNVSGGTANLTVSATTGTWEVKTIVRSI